MEAFCVEHWPADMDAVPLAYEPGIFHERLHHAAHGTYRHYKGPLYLLDKIAHQHDDRSLWVIYYSVDKQSWNLRPAVDFFQDVVWRGKIVPRFARVPV